MKVMVGLFTTESNANVPGKNEIGSYDLGFGDDCVRKLRVGEVFQAAGIDVIPSVYASAGASGVITRETFDYIESLFVRTVKEHLHEIDGIYLHLHGVSEVEGLGSGDHHILAAIRRLTGPYLPIAVACDPHGNLCQEYVDNCTILRSYRESPHTDADETKRQVAQMLCDLLKHRQNIHAIYRKLPLILGGEQSVSTDEPVRSINQFMNELEQDPRILSCSWHVGYIRHDSDVAGCGIVVVPATEKDIAYAETVADQLAAYVWDRRHEFHYTGLTAKPEKALEMALAFEGKPVFITDSGDNVTSGATGWNTFILRQVLAVPQLTKRFLFSNICDPDTWQLLDSLPSGTENQITLGVGADANSASVTLDVIVRSKGSLRGYLMHDHDAHYGDAVVVSVKGLPIEISVASTRQTMCEKHQFDALGINWDDYDVIVVKQGYIFPDLKAKGQLCIMSLTGGATPQDTASIPFKRIQRPMFPIDEI